MSYVDGFLTPVPKDRLDEYQKLADLSATVFIEHGALHYMESIGDDIVEGEHTDFFKAVDLKEGETVALAWIVYKSREHRDQVLAKAMNDTRMPTPEDDDKLPFDAKRLMWGGFKSIVDV